MTFTFPSFAASGQWTSSIRLKKITSNEALSPSFHDENKSLEEVAAGNRVSPVREESIIEKKNKILHDAVDMMARVVT